LDFQSALDLSTLTRNWINALNDRMELEFKLTNDIHAEHTIMIQGGLPQLPGSNITMPINGHQIDPNLLVEHDTVAQEDEPAVPDTPAQGPGPASDASPVHGPESVPPTSEVPDG
jgi:hypothetical protein